MSDPTKVFAKPAISIAEQIELLQQRGLDIGDVASAQQTLRHVGYYRLSAYMRPFQLPDGSHRFVEGSTFEQIADLYSFDRGLRIIFLDAIDRIEVAIRAATTESLSKKHGAHWYLDSRHFLPGADHGQLIEKLQDEIGHGDFRKRAVHVEHYYRNYNDPIMPPCWMLLEAVSFGSLANIVRKLNANNLKSVAWLIGVPDRTLQSWCLSISYLRNLCAHHSRVWNRVYTIKPLITRNHAEDLTPNDRTYAQAVTLRIMLGFCSGPSKWAFRLSDLLSRHSGVDLSKMGFPANWQDRPVWKP